MKFKKVAIILIFVCICFLSACGTDDGVTVLDINGDIVISTDGSITCDGAVISGSKNTNLKSSAEYVIKQDGSIIVRVDGKEYLIQKDVDVVIPAKDADIPQITTSSNNIYSIPLDGIKVGDTTITHDCSIVSGDNKISTDDKGNMVISTANGDYIINKKDVQPLSSNDDAVSVTLPDGQTVGVTDIMDIISGISINLDGSITIDGSIISNSDDGITLSTEFGDYAANVNNVTISAEEVKNLIYQITGEDGNVLDLINLAKDITVDKNGNVVTPNGTITIENGKVTVVAPQNSTAYTMPNGVIIDRGIIERLKDGTVILPEKAHNFYPEDGGVVVVYDNEMKFTPDKICYEYVYSTYTDMDGEGNYLTKQIAKLSHKAVVVTTTVYDYNILDEWNNPRILYEETKWIETNELLKRTDYEYDTDGFNTKSTTVTYNQITGEKQTAVMTFSQDNPYYYVIYQYDANDEIIDHTEIQNFDDPEISFPQVYKRFNSNGFLVHYSEMDKSGTEIVVCEYADDGTLIRYTTPNYSTYYHEDGTYTTEYWYADGSGGEKIVYATGNSIEYIRDTQSRYIYTYHYDSNGEMINSTHNQYDVDGYAKIITNIRNNYDETNPYKTIYCENANGITVFCQAFDQNGNLTAEYKYNDDGTSIYAYNRYANNKESYIEWNVDDWSSVQTQIDNSTGEKEITYSKWVENLGYEGIESDYVEVLIKRVYYYSNGNISALYEYDDNFESPTIILCEKYTEDGVLFYKETENYSISHNSDGSITEISKFADGSIKTVVTQSNGFKTEEITDASGIKIYSLSTDSNGNIISTYTVEYDVDGYAKVVTMIDAYANDSTPYKTVECRNSNNSVVFYQEYNKKGEVTREEKYNDDGSYKYCKYFYADTNTTMLIEYDVDDWSSITTEHNHTTGEKSISYSKLFQESTITVKVISYYANGSIHFLWEFEESLRNDTILHEEYYENGSLRYRETPDKSILYETNGMITENYKGKDGSIKTIITSANGTKTESYYDSQQRQIYYKQYDKNGNITNSTNNEFDIDGYAFISTEIIYNNIGSNLYKRVQYFNYQYFLVKELQYDKNGILISETVYN